jgi:hypothetical protein
VITARTNGAVLVVRMEQTSKELAARTVQIVGRAGGKVLGTFLTGLPTDREDADRVGYYRMNSENREMGEQERERERHRRDAEKRLREQEAAWLKQQEKDRRDKEDEPEV